MQDLKETMSHRAALKEHILEISMRAFIEHGIKAVKMDDIASMLGISKRTLYEIYEDKERLLYQAIVKYDKLKHNQLSAFAEAGHNVIEIILEAYRIKANELRMVNPVFYDDILKYPAVANYIKEVHERTRSNISQFLSRGADEGYFRKDIDYEMLVHLSDAIGQHIKVQKLHQRYTIQALFENFYLVILRGLCTQKGLEVLNAANL